jgi:hypothetical protein
MAKRMIVLLVSVAALAFPASALADGGSQGSSSKSPAQQCRAERTQIGADAFKQKYGTNKNKSNAFGKCVSKKAHEQTAARKSNSTPSTQGKDDDNDADENEADDNGKPDDSTGQAGEDHDQAGASHPDDD